MKKVLFTALAVAVGMTGFAQKVVVKDSAKNATMTAQRPSDVRTIDGSAAQGMQFNMPQNMVNSHRSINDFEEFEIMTTNYDLQSNSALGNRIAVWDDGSASFVMTWDHTGNTSFPDRGAGYNYIAADGSYGEEPEVRQEPMKSGWPSITACGEGEILASHASGTNVYYRPTRGEGDWELITNYPDATWPRVVCSGPNDKYVHLAFADQVSVGGVNVNHLYYARLERNGSNWEAGEMIEMPLIDNAQGGEYNNYLGADDYVMASNGNTVAILIGSYTTDLFYIISHDNGETWEKQMIYAFPVEGMSAYDWDNNPDGWPHPFITSDNSHSIAIDNNGVVHVAFGMYRWQPSDDDSYSYWPANNFGIVYWNSNYTNEQGGHNIPWYGDWSGDVNFNYGDTISYGLDIDRLDALCEADGHNNLHYFGYIDENGNGTLDYDNVIGASWHYRSMGLATLPGIAIDENGNMAICYNVWSETRVCSTTNFSYRSTYVTCRDNGGTWFDDAINLAESFVHVYEEQFSTTACAKAVDGSFWVLYSGDEAQGLYLDISDNYPMSNQGQLTENYIYAVKVTPAMEGWNVEDHQAVNPMTTTRVYPNPASDKLNIEVNASQASEMSITVYNITGQKVMEESTNITTGINVPSINTSNLTSGIYFVTVKANGFENTMKFIVK